MEINNSNEIRNDIKLETNKDKIKMQKNNGNNIKLEADKSKLGLIKEPVQVNSINNVVEQPVVDTQPISVQQSINTSNVQEIKHTKREYKTIDVNGGVETVYFFTCPTCGMLKEIRGKEINSVSERGMEVFCNCGCGFYALKPDASDFKAPSLMDTFGEFIQKDTNPETQNMLDDPNVDDVLNSIRDSFGINISKEMISKLPVGVKKVLRDILS